jgi:hypothetical protein
MNKVNAKGCTNFFRGPLFLGLISVLTAVQIKDCIAGPGDNLRAEVTAKLQTIRTRSAALADRIKALQDLHHLDPEQTELVSQEIYNGMLTFDEPYEFWNVLKELSPRTLTPISSLGAVDADAEALARRVADYSDRRAFLKLLSRNAPLAWRARAHSVVQSQALHGSFGHIELAKVAVDGKGAVYVLKNRYVDKLHPEKGFWPVLTKYRPDGTPDETFGPHGTRDILVDDQFEAQDIGIAADGSVFIAGKKNNKSLLVCKLSGSGQTDRSYGTGGLASRKLPQPASWKGVKWTSNDIRLGVSPTGDVAAAFVIDVEGSRQSFHHPTPFDDVLDKLAELEMTGDILLARFDVHGNRVAERYERLSGVKVAGREEGVVNIESVHYDGKAVSLSGSTYHTRFYAMRIENGRATRILQRSAVPIPEFEGRDVPPLRASLDPSGRYLVVAVSKPEEVVGPDPAESLADSLRRSVSEVHRSNPITVRRYRLPDGALDETFKPNFEASVTSAEPLFSVHTDNNNVYLAVRPASDSTDAKIISIPMEGVATPHETTLSHVFHRVGLCTDATIGLDKGRSPKN